MLCLWLQGIGGSGLPCPRLPPGGSESGHSFQPQEGQQARRGGALRLLPLLPRQGSWLKAVQSNALANALAAKSVCLAEERTAGCACPALLARCLPSRTPGCSLGTLQ